jgi:hypothetical protein
MTKQTEAGDVSSEELADRIVGAISDVSKSSRGLGRYSKWTRRGLYIIGILLLPDLLLTFWVKSTSDRADRAAASAQIAAVEAKAAVALAVTVQQDQYNRCLDGNKYRAADLKRWVTIIQQPPTPGETPAARTARLRNTAVFVQILQEQDKPVDCSKFAPRS